MCITNNSTPPKVAEMRCKCIEPKCPQLSSSECFIIFFFINLRKSTKGSITIRDHYFEQVSLMSHVHDTPTYLVDAVKTTDLVRSLTIFYVV